MKIKSTDQETQGEFVVINDEDFDPEKHTPFDTAPEPKPVMGLEDTPKRRGRPPVKTEPDAA